MEAITSYFENLDTAMLIAWGWKILAALMIFVIGRWVAKAVRNGVQRMMTRRGLDPMLVSFLGAILYAILLMAVIIAAIGQLGIQTTPLIAVLGAAGLAVGLALQGSLSNFASGVMLVLFRPFRKGDYVEAGGTSGTVDEVGIFNTIMTTPDNRRIIVPNGMITSDTITNYSANDTRRIDMIIGVDYGDDLKLARATIERILSDHDKVLDEPEPIIWVMDLADSSVNLAVRPWVATENYWQVRNELLEQLKAGLEAAGCTIPFPQRDVHLHNVESLNTGT
ncbi:MAG: mechanosensitive ion channel [Wenzhouxiangellaceae bacterium]|nr:mechanosensitive ion channel [Wenzhouxiangellaceae bacterium]